MREVPGTVYVITEEDIRRYGYRDLQEILHRIPSMEMLREGAETKGGVRGFLGSAKPLIMINGREVVQHKPLSPYISHQFRANMIKRVEIVQGPASALYGANAFSGIINIITKDAKVTKYTGYPYAMGGDYRTYEGGASSEKKISENASLAAQAYSFYSRGEDFSDFWSPTNPKNWTFLGWYPREEVNKGQAPYSVVSTGAPALGGLTPSYQTDAAKRFSELYPSRDLRSFFPFVNPARATGGNMEFQHKYFYVGLDYFLVHTGTYYPIKKTNHSNDHIERQLMTGFVGFRELPLFWGFNLSMDIMVQREDSKQQIQYGYSILEFDSDGNLNTQNANAFAQGVFANEGNMRYKGFLQFDKDFSNIGNYLIFGFGYDRYNTATSIANYLPGFVGTFATFLPRGNPAPWEPDERAFYKQNKISFYIQDQQNLYSRSLQLTLGARFDRHNIYGTVFNPRIGLVYTPEFLKRNTFKFLYGTAFREPSVFKYSTNVDFFVSRIIQAIDTGYAPLDTYLVEQVRKRNTTEPEKVRTFEFSWVTTPFNWVTHTLSLYRSWGENIIVPKPSPDGVTLSFGNERNRRVDGLESYLRLRYRDLGLFTSYSQYLKTEGTRNHKYIQSDNYAYIRGFEYAYPLKISDRHMNIYPRQFSFGIDIRISFFGAFSPTLSLEHLWKDAMYTIGQDENGEPIKVKSPIFRQNNVTISILNLDSF